MESQKIINLLNHKDEDDPRFETRKWYIVNDHNNGNYNQGDDVQSIVKFNTKIVKPFLCDYSDAYILVTGNIKVQNGNNATRVAIKNCHPFTRASFKLNNEQVETAGNLDLTMNLYNTLEYSDNYADTTGSLYQYKGSEPRDPNGNVVNLSTTLSSFKYQSGLVQKQLTRTKLRKKKYNRLLYLAKNKLDCIEMLISNSIKDGIISHDEFLEILKEKKEYDCLKN